MKTTFVKESTVELEEIIPGMKRKILGYDTDLMLVRVWFDKDVVAPRHNHPHQQVSYVEKGRFNVEIEGIWQELEAGDCFIIPSNDMHHAICLEEGILIDTFSPCREDFLETPGAGYADED